MVSRWSMFRQSSLAGTFLMSADLIWQISAAENATQNTYQDDSSPTPLGMVVVLLLFSCGALGMGYFCGRQAREQVGFLAVPEEPLPEVRGEDAYILPSYDSLPHTNPPRYGAV